MKAALKKVTYSDNSKARLLIVNNGEKIGNMKITVKQWQFLQKMGIEEEKGMTGIDKDNH